jgi:hypothetical protein
VHAVALGRGGRAAPVWLECFAFVGAFVLALGAMVLFMTNTIADRVGTLIEQQNAAALKLSDNLHYFELHAPNEESMPPGLFSDLVEFSRNTAIIMYEVRRLLAVEVVSTFGAVKTGIDTRLPDGGWSQALMQEMKTKDGSATVFDHTGVDPSTDGKTIVAAGNYQIRLYQSLRDFWQENCTSYKDARVGISTYLLPLLYALLGAALCDLRCRFGTVNREVCQPTSLGSARYATAMIAGAVIGVFTSLFPTSLSLPPLLVAFLLGYSVEIFTSRLDALIDNLRAGRGET